MCRFTLTRALLAQDLTQVRLVVLFFDYRDIDLAHVSRHRLSPCTKTLPCSTLQKIYHFDAWPPSTRHYFTSISCVIIRVSRLTFDVPHTQGLYLPCSTLQKKLRCILIQKTFLCSLIILLLQHSMFVLATKTLPQRLCHKDFATKTLPQRHCHKDIATKTLPLTTTCDLAYAERQCLAVLYTTEHQDTTYFANRTSRHHILQ